MTAANQNTAASRLDALIDRKLTARLAPLRREIKTLRADLDAIEDAGAIRALQAASSEESFPAEIARRLVAGDPPLKVFREYRGLTQSELAEAADTSAQYISQIERGGREIGKKLAPRLAAALKIDADDLR